MARRAGLLNTLDANGDMVGVNYHEPRAAPLVRVGRDLEADTVHFNATASTEFRARVNGIVAAADPWVGGLEPSGLGAALLDGLGSSGWKLTLYEGPAYRFPPPLMVPFGATRLYPGHAHLLHPELADLAEDLRHSRPVFAVLRDSRAVSVCFSARISSEAAEAGVKTVEAFRGRGCAQLATDAWASEIRKMGRIPLYSTSWENRASQAVARKLELELIGEDIHLTPVGGYS